MATIAHRESDRPGRIRQDDAYGDIPLVRSSGLGAGVDDCLCPDLHTPRPAHRLRIVHRKQAANEPQLHR